MVHHQVVMKRLRTTPVCGPQNPVQHRYTRAEMYSCSVVKLNWRKLTTAREILSCESILTIRCYYLALLRLASEVKTSLRWSWYDWSRYLGGWPSEVKFVPPGSPAIVDVTCELPVIHRDLPHLNLLVWDTKGGPHLVSHPR